MSVSKRIPNVQVCFLNDQKYSLEERTSFPDDEN